MRVNVKSTKPNNGISEKFKSFQEFRIDIDAPALELLVLRSIYSFSTFFVSFGTTLCRMTLSHYDLHAFLWGLLKN